MPGLGIEDYGSDSDTGPEDKSPRPPRTSTPKESNKAITKSKRPPKKITIGLPNLPKSADDDPEHDDLEDERPPLKKLRKGSGMSSLLSMLPAPKQQKPVQSQSERVLGGGNGPSFAFNQKSTSAVRATSEEGENKETSEAISLIPPSLSHRKPNISLEDTGPTRQSKPAAPVDFFSLGDAASKIQPLKPSQSSSTPQTLSSAPVMPTFQPPEPQITDPYPGYYQLPSGSWAAHDPAYYATFTAKWQADYDAQVKALEKGGGKGFEDLTRSNVTEVDALKEMERAKNEIKEREERKAITKGAGSGSEEPRMKISASKMSGIARSRHQLSTLLKEAYENREALEERIAEGRRNRKEAGNKYGF